MLETASREIRRAAEAADVERQTVRRLPALVGAIDGLLSELEELNLWELTRAPGGWRERASELVALALRLPAPPRLTDSVKELMERLYEAQEIALRRRRRIGLGLGDIPAVPPPGEQR
jgi:hypothetical protein